ncbi:hypothetical protein K435DRAFT_966037 [Dendrothele bispora CBS 962.96]|uniref:Protein-S-isoprenylcysteine O-methyltransferase n=1 Tax=Dendrothele bispora (strain CBS 962.96) TaxID=1314807 RepID=A0A4S8M2F0_DENBC|nr:hypothetical protein K435DRAFT_966037 [Dendrothele bispora CBS 962.96]
MFILKTICLVLAAGCVHLAWTSPNARPAINELRLAKRRHEKILTKGMQQALHWSFVFIFILEAVVTMLSHQDKYIAVSPSIHYISSIFTPKTQVSHDSSEEGVGTTHLDLQPGLQFFLGITIMFLATFLRYRCYQTLGRHFTFEAAILKDHQLITSGPYSVIRHPGFSASLLLSLGIFIVLSSNGSWTRESEALRTSFGQLIAIGYGVVWVAVFGSLGARLPKEERMLKKEFGKQWVDWKNRVPWKLVPGVY